ncbi:2445_t:CDS:2 [Acaulospora morrowiae]|uniref:2445_t:CDS:1 n=1 Tax=Acaulospora morrowiae TaxID=94023 RepID=A0A9N9FL10_9GLOM|nr:2445_t:CDS:2 [Acaulospora morrowiae]
MTDSILKENQISQEEEILALSSIFGQESVIPVNQASPYLSYNFRLSLESDLSYEFNKSSTVNSIILNFHFPEDYPSASPPIYEIVSLYCGTLRIDNKIRNEIDEKFKELFIPGKVVIFEWIEWLRELLSQKLAEEQCNKTDTHTNANADSYKPKEGSNVEAKEDFDIEANKIIKSDCPPITSGEPLEHKKSVFVAHLAPVHNAQEVKMVRETLMLNKKIAKATHNIMAYRIIQDNGVILQDNDDDGETAAGGRLLHLLQILDAKNVLVVVSRWFGGILLGPDRFKDINNVARDLLENCGYIEGGKGGKVKK